MLLDRPRSEKVGVAIYFQSPARFLERSPRRRSDQMRSHRAVGILARLVAGELSGALQDLRRNQDGDR
jgi:hypothetical protein